MTKESFDSVVILSPFHWNFRNDLLQTTHHVAREFSRICPTVLVEPSLQWNPRAEQFRLHRLLHGLFGFRTRSPRENLVVFRRRGLPLGRLAIIRQFDLRRNARALRRYLSERGFRRTLLWHSFPYWSEPLMDAVDHTVFAYHCLDRTTREEELDLVHRADTVFCVSGNLVHKHRPLNPNTHLMSNGVDLQLFTQDNPAIGKRPADLPTDGPLIGYAGGMNSHLDFELLVKVARAFPTAYLVMIGYAASRSIGPRGSQKQAQAKLRGLRNVKMLGFRSVEQIPAYYNAFNVCLIPLRADEFNRECDPGKFYQYAAIGKPIVTSPTSVTRRHCDLCYVAESHEEFIGCISNALRETNSSELSEKRILMARSYSWESIVGRAYEQLSRVGRLQPNGAGAPSASFFVHHNSH
jgi:glycosyltransferase involved in cell wall biosynthesis